MRIKTVFGIVAALVPIGYCGYLFFYFLNVGGSAQESVTNGLGPTILGLGGIGLLFCVPLVLRFLRGIADSRAPKPPTGSWDDANFVAESSFDADAALARYMARKNAEPDAPALSPQAPLVSTAPRERDAPAPRPSFGRKIG